MNESVSRFYEAIDELQESINALKTVKYEDNHKITLFFNLIEMIAKAAYGDELSNGKRFEKFIVDFCAWDDANRVSIQQLDLLLRKESRNEFNKLKVYVKQNLAKWPKSQQVPFGFDPTLTEIKEYWPPQKKVLDKVGPENLQHVKLMWRLRNSLTHEMRNKSLPKLFESRKPHYIPFSQLAKNKSTNKLEIQEDHYVLYYPPAFLNNLITISKLNTEKYFESEEIDPLANFSFDYLWV